MEEFHLRIRAELERLGLSQAEAARKAGEKSPQRLRDVLIGKQRCPLELLSALCELGVSAGFVVTGDRNQVGISDEHARLIAAYDAAPAAIRAASLAVLGSHAAGTEPALSASEPATGTQKSSLVRITPGNPRRDAAAVKKSPKKSA